jgi:hypothetical protein
MAVSQLFTLRPALNSAGVVTGGGAGGLCSYTEASLSKNSHYSSFVLFRILFILTISHDVMQRTARRHSTPPSVKLHTLSFNILQLLLRSLFTKFKERSAGY